MELEMEGGGEYAANWLKLMIETAKEELEMLESNHPNQFEFFKVELKSFISLHHHHPPLSTSTIATEASTSGMKRKSGCFMNKSKKVKEDEREKASTTTTTTTTTTTKGSTMEKVKRKKVVKEEDERVEVALERAKACLQKIHEVKTQLLLIC